MGRTAWVKPMTLVQKFEANEYVASACWGVGCDTTAANAWDGAHPQYHPNAGSTWFPYYPNHDPASCGDATHQFVKDVDGNGTPDIMYELKDGQELECAVFSDPDYTNPININNITPGMTIYWTTVTDTGKIWPNATEATWHHQGKVEATYPGHPLRS